MLYELKNDLRTYRAYAGLTQTELANLCDTTKNTISNIENCVYSPTAYMAARICRALKCSFEDIFYLEVLK